MVTALYARSASPMRFAPAVCGGMLVRREGCRAFAHPLWRLMATYYNYGGMGKDQRCLRGTPPVPSLGRLPIGYGGLAIPPHFGVLQY